MTNDGFEDRRIGVEKFLKKGTDAKLLRGGTDQALEDIRRAYDLANEEPGLPAPWPQLTAYRFAHLMLRRPEGMDLEKVDSFFQEANSGDHLGPVPRIFRLVVLHRILLKTRSHEEKSFLKRQIEIVHREAVDSVRRHLHEVEVPEDEQEPYRRAPLQESVANLLELATYFLELDYTLLEGIGGPFSDLNLGEDSWFLVGPTPSMATIRYPRHLAEVELKERGSANPGAVLFRLCPDRVEWKGLRDWDRANKDQVHLLAHLLISGEAIETHRLIDLVLGDLDSEEGTRRYARFRKTIQRFRENLIQLVDGQISDPLIFNESGKTYRLSPALMVFGIVDSVTLNRGPSH